MKNRGTISDWENYIEVDKSVKDNYTINGYLRYNKKESIFDFILAIQKYIDKKCISECFTENDIKKLYENYRIKIDDTCDFMFSNIIYVNNYKEKLKLVKELMNIFNYSLFTCIGDCEDIIETFIKQSLSKYSNTIFVDPRIKNIQKKYLYMNNSDLCCKYFDHKIKTSIKEGLHCVIHNLNCSHSYSDAFFAFIDTDFHVWETIAKYQTIDDLYLNISNRPSKFIQIITPYSQNFYVNEYQRTGYIYE